MNTKDIFGIVGNLMIMAAIFFAAKNTDPLNYYNALLVLAHSHDVIIREGLQSESKDETV